MKVYWTKTAQKHLDAIYEPVQQELSSVNVPNRKEKQEKAGKGTGKICKTLFAVQSRL